MKTYKEFITELNKFELMLKAGKTGLKMFKGKKPSHSTIIGLRSKFGNRFVSPRREAENLMKGFQLSQNKKGKGDFVVGSLETAARQFGGGQGGRFASKSNMKELDRLYRTNRPSDRHYRSVIKNMGTQNRQIYQRPYPATTDAQDFMNKADVFQSKDFPIFPKNKLGAPTTTNIKKGSIPEPKKKKLRKEEVMAAPTNSVGGGQIAGTVEAGDNPPVKKKKRYIYGGTGSRKMWMNNK